MFSDYLLKFIINIQTDFLKDKEKVKEYADMAAAINPVDYILESAYYSAGIEYDPLHYEDIFKISKEKSDISPEPEKEELTEKREYVTVNPNPSNPHTTFTYSIN